MLSRDFGGIQQSFLDYNKALCLLKHEVISVTSTNASVNDRIDIKNYTLPNLISFDPISKLLLWRLIKTENPDVIIAHGSRAINFAYSAKKFSKNPPVLVGVAHNYWYKPLLKCNYVFSITKHLKAFLITQGIEEDRIFLMPNVVDISAYSFDVKKSFSPGEKITVGVLARFVHKKGVDVFIRGIKLLKDRGINIHAKIGGEGEEREKLELLIKNLDLKDEVSFVGWVNDKAEFLKDVDIICIPSREEPFGITILEAALNQIPMVTTKTVGALEIFEGVENIQLIDIDSPNQIALSIEHLIKNKAYAAKSVKAAFIRVKENYDIKDSANRLKTYIAKIK